MSAPSTRTTHPGATQRLRLEVLIAVLILSGVLNSANYLVRGQLALLAFTGPMVLLMALLAVWLRRCKGLVDPAACAPSGPGTVSCSQAGLVSDGEGCCSNSGSSTASCTIDYCIVIGTSGCVSGYYKARGQKFRCPSCQDLNQCAAAAVQACQ